jgi:lipoprotein-anchoring transpeptidase ErfK/SrfK
MKFAFRFAFVLITALFALLPAQPVPAAENPTPMYLIEAMTALKEVPSGRWLIISKQHFTLYVMEGKQVVQSYGVAVGKNTGNKQKVGDMRTPEGMFEIQQIQNASSWTHDFKDGKGEIKGAYGPWFIRLKTGWQGIGIHGTHDPLSIGTNATEGCIRLMNPDVDYLKEVYARIGMKVLILK